MIESTLRVTASSRQNIKASLRRDIVASLRRAIRRLILNG